MGNPSCPQSSYPQPEIRYQDLIAVYQPQFSFNKAWPDCSLLLYTSGKNSPRLFNGLEDRNLPCLKGNSPSQDAIFHNRR